MSDTPLTDKLAMPSRIGGVKTEIVPADFARELEDELNKHHAGQFCPHCNPCRRAEELTAERAKHKEEMEVAKEHARFLFDRIGKPLDLSSLDIESSDYERRLIGIGQWLQEQGK